MRPIDMELQKISDTKKVWDIMHPTDMMGMCGIKE